MSQKVDISHRTIVFIAVFILGLWLTILIRDLLLLLFVALILMSALSPLVNFLAKYRVPKALGIAISYVIIISLFGGIIASLLPPVIEESSKLFTALPNVVNPLLNNLNVDKNILQSEFANFSKNLITFLVGAFDNFLTITFLLVLTFYLLLEKEKLEDRISALFVGREQRIKNIIVQLEEKLGAWLRGQVVLSVIIGLLSYIGLTLLNIPYALPLALLAGIMEIIPVIGPIISAVPAIALGFTISPLVAAGAAATYFIIQQLENHLIVPQVMKRAVGLNPLIVILAIAIGGRLLGIAGALLAVPIVVVLQVVVMEVIQSQRVEK
ncbi:AI-2E family transporter [Candidatus Daviesbacteria bacterium]|nr:AI-2E family transporter [Candidatus Daviesbacteria bacterium]